MADCRSCNYWQPDRSDCFFVVNGGWWLRLMVFLFGCPKYRLGVK
jgi:hypothetical protein